MLPVCSCCLNTGSHSSTRYWSGIESWKFGKHGSVIACSDGMSDCACVYWHGFVDRLGALVPVLQPLRLPYHVSQSGASGRAG